MPPFSRCLFAYVSCVSSCAEWGHVSVLRRGRPVIVARWCGTEAIWTVSIDGVQYQERPLCVEQAEKAFPQEMGPEQGLGFSLVGIGMKGLGIALHICSFVHLGLLEIHLEICSDRLF